jgi:hypothetical protein
VLSGKQPIDLGQSLVPGHLRVTREVIHSIPTKSMLNPQEYTGTIWAWLICLIPLMEALIVVAVIFFTTIPILFDTGAVIVAGMFAKLLFAEADMRALERREFSNLPTKYLALLPPVVYLGVRGSRLFDQTHSGLKPFWANIGLMMALPFAYFLLATFGNGLFIAAHVYP